MSDGADRQPDDPALPRVPTSAILEDLVRSAPGQGVTLRWLLDRLSERSFGIVMLLAALLAVVPGLSPLAALLLAIVAVQMILGRPAPVLPRFLADRQLATARLARMVARTAPVLRYLERFVRPRWHTHFQATKRVIGAVTLLLCTTLLAPIPFSQVVPAFVIALLAIAFLEADGVLLAVALAAALVSLAATAAAAWGTIEAGMAL